MQHKAKYYPTKKLAIIMGLEEYLFPEPFIPSGENCCSSPCLWVLSAPARPQHPQRHQLLTHETQRMSSPDFQFPAFVMNPHIGSRGSWIHGSLPARSRSRAGIKMLAPPNGLTEDRLSSSWFHAWQATYPPGHVEISSMWSRFERVSKWVDACLMNEGENNNKARVAC